MIWKWYKRLSGRLAFDPRERAMAAGLPLARRQRRGLRCLSRQPQLSMRSNMIMTKRKPASVGEILFDEFMQPLGLTQGYLAHAMVVPPQHVNELCNDRRAITADTALIL